MVHLNLPESLAYVSPYPVPSEKADAAQDVAMCSALASVIGGVTLVYVPDGNDSSPTDAYGISQTFRLAPVGGGRFFVRRAGRVAAVGEVLSALVCALRAAWLRADLYLTRNPVAGWFLVLIGSRVVWEAVSFPDRLKSLFARRLMQSRRLELIVTITDGLRRDLLDHFESDVPSIALPVGVDLSRYGDVRATSDRSEWGLHTSDYVAVYTGWLRSDRGVDVIVRAATLVPDVKFLIVGGRENEIALLQDLAERIGATNVRFAGRLPPSAVPDVQRMADVVLLPQRGSSRHLSHHVSSAKVFEYMAVEKPIIASDLPCMREVLDHERNALLVAQDDPAGWASAIGRLRNDRDLGVGLAKAAREGVRRYDWSMRADRLLRQLDTS